ncbi:restriction endonuclease fold toxin-2 domain-containing protein [Streptomyces sp. NPDC056696]|uniref:restriction endonuclease fold toxin-2 domain-containing protein n=1 Tax=unclassified Streptomyces TaxID=2593676 RepID=UPI00368A9F41
MVQGDANEMVRYRAALADRRNNETRTFEITTADEPAALYWQDMPAMIGSGSTATHDTYRGSPP